MAHDCEDVAFGQGCSAWPFSHPRCSSVLMKKFRKSFLAAEACTVQMGIVAAAMPKL